MNEKAAYETFGTRPDGSSFIVEILGYQTPGITRYQFLDALLELSSALER